MELSDLPESKMREVLQLIGVLGPVTLDSQVVQPPSVQVGQYNPAIVGKSDRMLSIIVNGLNNAATSEFYQDYNVTLVVAGLPDRSDMIMTKLMAHNIESELIKFVPNQTPGVCGQVMGVVPGGVFGPFYDDNGRVVFELRPRLMIS